VHRIRIVGHHYSRALAAALAGGTLLAAITLTPTLPAAEAQGQAAGRIPGQYIIVLKEGVAGPREVAREMAAKHGADVFFTYEFALKGFAARIPEARLPHLASDPRVRYIEPDGVASVIAQELPWGVDYIDADQSSTRAGDGSGSVDGMGIAIIDTGIDTRHSDLNVAGGINYSGGKSDNYADGNGHGTHCAGIAAAKDNGIGVVGVAPGASLYAVKVLGNSGSGSWSAVIKGCDWVTARAGTIDVANLSLGGPANQAVDEAVERMVSAGIVVAVAAGNDGADASDYSPARTPNAITVGAHDRSGATASFSNTGDRVDVYAPGVGILSTYKKSSYAILSGTSMAAPHVAGAAALYLSTHPGALPQQVRDALVGAGMNVSGF
jgi:subtilisin family serine protease